MAVDEVLLEEQARGLPAAPPVLRLYAWDPPALSLGRSQPAQGSHEPGFLREQSIDLVRRPTGGAAVLHEHERTYAVVGKLGEGAFPRGVRETYRRIAAVLAEALAELGVSASIEGARSGVRPDRFAACFGGISSHEISVDGLKLIGAAQARRRGAFLQHGSILLRADPQRLAGALGTEGVEGFTDLERAAGRRLSAEELDRCVIAAFERGLDLRWIEGGLSQAEREQATHLRAWKYRSASWTLDGRVTSA